LQDAPGGLGGDFKEKGDGWEGEKEHDGGRQNKNTRRNTYSKLAHLAPSEGAGFLEKRPKRKDFQTAT